MTFASSAVPHDQVKKLARLIDQGGAILVVDAALISPSERDQIERAIRGDATTPAAMAQWKPEWRAMLAELSSGAHGQGSLESPPDFPQPAYAQIFEACLKELQLLPFQEPAPWAYWQALADGVQAEPASAWMAVEPCQWLVSTQQVQLKRSAPNQQMSPHLIQTIEAGLGRLRASLVLGRSGRAYLRFEAPFELRSAWPECLEGLGTDDFLPQGSQARDWRGFVTELEMALAMNPDPSNSDTQSLWPWGMGTNPNDPGLASGAIQAKRPINSSNLTKAPLPLQGFKHWLESQGHPLNLEWHSFKPVQRVEEWIAEWTSVLETIEALKQSCMNANDSLGRPWAVLLQDQWSYKLYVQPEGKQRQSGPTFLNIAALRERLRGLSQAGFSFKERHAKRGDSLTQLLKLASWSDEEIS
jgi:hypothetical protein